MAETVESPLQHHFVSLEQQYETSTLGIWAFLITEIMFFGGLFTLFSAYVSVHAEGFAEGSKHLDLLLGISKVLMRGGHLHRIYFERKFYSLHPFVGHGRDSL